MRPVGRVRALDDRQRERERLPGSGRRLGEHVEPAERVRQDERLDTERRSKPAGLQHLGDVGADAERPEGLF